MQTTRLTERQIKRLCDEVATTLIDVLNSQNADEKIKVTINDFLTTHNLNNDASELLKRMSWSVKVSLKE
jgi:phenylpyruvate tautomerase PptA (4-oxalocrotonate tautomerase family)